MIKYTLICAHSHQFESWFKSSTDFEKLELAKMLECVICGDSNIQKTIMAPSVNTQKKTEAIPNIAKAIQAAKESIKGAKNVGWQFAKEARAIHYGDKEDAPIYGRTEPEEAIELLKEGIKIAPLPFDPDAKDN